MNDIIEFLTSKEIIVVYVVLAVACILCFIIYLVDKSRDNRKRKQNTKQLNKLVEDVNAKIQEESLEKERMIKNKKVVENIDLENPRKRQSLVERIEDETMQMEVVKDSLEPETIENMAPNYQNQLIEESKNIRENPQVAEEKVPVSNQYPVQSNGYVENNAFQEDMSSLQKEATNSIEQAMNHQINKVSNKIEELTYTDPVPNKEEATRELIKLAEELERVEKAGRNSKMPDIDISKYETEQEENAIISLEELSKKSEKMYAENEVTQYADEGNEPISLEDLERRKRQVVNSEWSEQYPQNTQYVQNTQPVNSPVTQEQRYEDLSFSSTGVVTQNNSTPHGAYQGGRIITQEVFSPVFGFDTKKKQQEEIDEDLEKTSQFLLSLKELQSKLNS